MFSDPVSVLQEYLVHNNLDPPSYTSLISDKIYSITLVAIVFVFYDFTAKLENFLNIYTIYRRRLCVSPCVQKTVERMRGSL